MFSRRAALLAGLVPSVARARSVGAAPVQVRVGVLRSGSVGWALDVVRRHGLDVNQGFEIHPTPFADAASCDAALRGGAVDIAARDWLFVARERAAGADWRFAACSTGLGCVMAPADGAVATLADLSGKRLGVLGADDFGWRVLQAHASRRGIDLAAISVAPTARLAEQLASGGLDAMLAHWPDAVRAQAEGARPVLDLAVSLRELGVPGGMPVTGYVFAERWARANRRALDGFLAATAAARAVLAVSDGEWTRLWPKMGTNDAATFAALRDRFRRGIPDSAPAAQIVAATALHAALGEPGDLGGVFWDA